MLQQNNQKDQRFIGIAGWKFAIKPCYDTFALIWFSIWELAADTIAEQNKTWMFGQLDFLKRSIKWDVNWLQLLESWRIRSQLLGCSLTSDLPVQSHKQKWSRTGINKVTIILMSPWKCCIFFPVTCQAVNNICMHSVHLSMRYLQQEATAQLTSVQMWFSFPYFISSEVSPTSFEGNIRRLLVTLFHIGWNIFAFFSVSCGKTARFTSVPLITGSENNYYFSEMETITVNFFFLSSWSVSWKKKILWWLREL